MNALFVKAHQTVLSWLKVPALSQDSNMFDRLFDEVLVLLPWVALIPMTLCEDSTEELMWCMRAVHLDLIACPVKLCSGAMASVAS